MIKPVEDQTPALDSKKHGKLLDKVLEWLDVSAEGKREVERLALHAERHYRSFLDPRKHAFPTKTYDPIFFSSTQGSVAKHMEALFGGDDLVSFTPRGATNHDVSNKFTSLMSYHHGETRPRQRIKQSLITRSLAGTTFAHVFWDHQKRKVGAWKRAPIQTISINPMTGQPEVQWTDQGSWEYRKEVRVIRDSPNLKPLAVWQAFPDDSGNCLEDAEFFIFTDYISAHKVEAMVKDQGWSKSAFKMAENSGHDAGSAIGKGREKIRNRLEWLEEIGVRASHLRSAFADSRGKSRVMEVLECWYLKNNEVRRCVILNRVAIAFDGPSPYGHGKLPFVMSRNYSMPSQFWGISDYEIVRWLIQGIQTLRNANVTESVLAALPPALIPEGLTFTGKNYAPMAEWRYDGPIEGFRFFERSSQARQASSYSCGELAQQMDNALGTSDVSRGNAAGTKGVAATNVNLAYESANLKEKLSIDDYGDEFLIPYGDQCRELIRQFQDYETQLRISGNPEEEPVTFSPDEWRDADLMTIPVISTSQAKMLDQKRKEALYQTVVQFGEESANRRELFEAYVRSVDPQNADRIVKSQEQIEQEQMMMQQQAMMQAGPGGPGGDLGGGSLDAMQAELGAAMGAA